MSAFEDFWPHYVRLHTKPETQRLHAIASIASIALVGAGVATGNLVLVVLGPLADYAIAQTSHRIFEKNATTPWKNQLWHTRAEMRMLRLTLTGRMSREVERAR